MSTVMKQLSCKKVIFFKKKWLDPSFHTQTIKIKIKIKLYTPIPIIIHS